MARVTYVDETTSGGRGGSWGLEIAEERLTVGELVRRRVFQEVAENYPADGVPFRGLVQPAGTAAAPDAHRSGAPRRIDSEQKYALAREAFGRNGFLVLVGDRQVQEWDEEVDLPPGTEVVFLKLVPLVGG
ncbi:hypothetical protein [Actinacidiphila sp. bgisy144]|uniref:hypothetical protein n=1 Tax=Actinacidiphila sp. bgisy144 TaxID=3413791 RepID=UPI003EBEB22E